MSLALIEQNIHFLRQGADLIRRLDDEAYTAPALDGSGSGVGPHLRHCIDFYRCLLRDLASGRIDYDRRARQERIETDRGAGVAVLEEVIEQLRSLEGEDPGRRVAVRTDVAPFEDPAAAWSGSTVGRELRFLVSHTVHHYALIALILRARGLEPGEELGVAPSTLAYRKAGA